jgi:hypothetical protein
LGFWGFAIGWVLFMRNGELHFGLTGFFMLRGQSAWHNT